MEENSWMYKSSSIIEIGNITGKQARERYINKLDTKINK